MAAAVDSAVSQALGLLGDLPGALLPVLHEVQHQLGYVPKEAVPAIAEGLNLSRAEVHGVISFYHHFHSEPLGTHVVQICRAEACQAVGARALETHVKKTLGVDYGDTTVDGKVSLEPVYCLGNCACGPSVQVNDRLHARVSAADFDALMTGLTTAVEGAD